MSASVPALPENLPPADEGMEPPGGDEPVSEAEVKALTKLWADPPGIYGFIAAVQNDAVGGRLIIASFIFFLLAGLIALGMRIQLFVPENTFLGPREYNQFYTMHGSTMMYLFAVPFIEGVAILLLPSIIGNRELPYPRLGAFSQWTFVFGGILFYASFLLGTVPENGWYAYVPLSGPEFSPGLGMEFWLLALSVAEVGAIAAGVEIVTAIMRMRAPGMSIGRMPVYIWSMLITAFMILFAFTPLIVGSLLLELDRKVGTQFFNPNAGGSALLWQHIFWIFGHPEVYIQFIPAAGVVSMIIPVFARKRLTGYSLIVMSMVATGFISFGLWAHHMFTVGLPQVGTTFFAAASILIAIPAGIQVFSWLATIWGGRPVFKTPFLFALGFIFLFTVGGVTGVMVGSVPFDQQVHDSYFIVAHFHYVLIGGVTFPLFAAVYYWIPKASGRLMSERLGRWNFWTMFIGFNLTFFPMHISGLLGMPRRYYTYLPGLGWDLWNQLSTIGSFVFAIGVGLFVINFVLHFRNGEKSGPNPWGADSLEWGIGSPAVNYSFGQIPIVRSRHPMWDQDGIYSGDPRLERFSRAIAKWPLNWRAAVTTSLLDGSPQEVFRVNGPSALPFVAACGMALIFGGEIFELRMVSLAGILIVVGSLIAWNWPRESPTSQEQEEAFARATGVAVYPNGSRSVARWGMGLTLLILGIALGCFLLAYFYIRLENPIWPPQSIPLPSLLLPTVMGILLLLSGGAAGRALSAVRNDGLGRMRLWLGITLILGLAALGIQIYYFSGLNFDWRTTGYGSAFYGLAWFTFLLLIAGSVMNLLVQIWSRRRPYSAADHVAVENLVTYWLGAVVGWWIASAVIYGLPYLT